MDGRPRYRKVKVTVVEMSLRRSPVESQASPRSSSPQHALDEVQHDVENSVVLGARQPERVGAVAKVAHLPSNPTYPSAHKAH